MNNIIYNDNIITPENNKYQYYKNFTKKLNGRDCVKLALFSAKAVNNNSKESFHCIALVERWLKDGNSVNRQELYDASASATSDTYYATYAAYATTAYYADAKAHAVHAVVYAVTSAYSINIDDINLYLKTLLRTTKQYNTINHNNQHYEFILKQIIKEDIDNLTDTDYNMLIDLSQEYYNINPNIINKRILIELLRKEYE